MEILNFTPPQFHSRYHRLDLQLEDKEPEIDDVNSIQELQTLTERMLAEEDALRDVIDNWMASLFYINLQNLQEVEDKFLCTGYIRCRQHLPQTGYDALLMRMQETSAYFLVNGSPIPCIKTLRHKPSTFRCIVKFYVEDLSSDVNILLGGLTAQRWPISGLPQSVENIIQLQGSNTPFGRSDHKAPTARSRSPRKRTRSDC
jgi:hypothetical protein